MHQQRPNYAIVNQMSEPHFDDLDPSFCPNLLVVVNDLPQEPRRVSFVLEIEDQSVFILSLFI